MRLIMALLFLSYKTDQHKRRNIAILMNMNEAIIELKEKGLPFPSPISVLLLYDKKNDCYQQKIGFVNDFFTLLEVQKTIQYPR